MAFDRKATRRELVNRGWYVPVAVEVVLLLDLSGNALKALIAIQHLQGDQAGKKLTQEYLAVYLRMPIRTVKRAVKELKDAGLLEISRTNRNSDAWYSVTFCALDYEAAKGLDAERKFEAAGESRGAKSGPSEDSRSAKSGTSSFIEEPTTSKNLSPDASASGTETEAVVIPMPRKPLPERDEFDPNTSLNLWESQEALEGPSAAPEGLFPAQEVASGLRSRQKGPSQAQLDSPDGLARYFASELAQTDWAGPKPVNLAALRKNLSDWKKAGVSSDTIRDMMRRYIADRGMRREGIPPWSDFVYKRHKLLAALERSNAARAMEEHRYDHSYWTGDIPDAAKALAERSAPFTPGMTAADMLNELNGDAA